MAVDLFAGAGGLSLGLEQAGFDVLAALEYDPVHAATHLRNFPYTEVVCDDATTVTVDRLRQAVEIGWHRQHRWRDFDGEVDLVVGGPPCQGFSWMGKRRDDDARNDLVFHFHRLVTGLRPRYFLMENVPGILDPKTRPIVEDLIDRFEAAGYRIEAPKILNAAHYGVPQDRRRFILVGARTDVAGDFAWPVPTTNPVRPVRSDIEIPAGLPTGPSVAQAIGDLPDLDQYPELLSTDSVDLGTAWEITPSYARTMAGLDHDPANLGSPRPLHPTWLTASARTVHTPTSVARFDGTQPGQVEPVSHFLRLDPEGLCNTLRAGTSGERGAFTSPRPIHPWLPRVLSVREGARLHSYPDWFRPHATKAHGFRQVGNSVPPLLARALGNSITAALGLSPRRGKPKQTGAEHLLHLTVPEAAELLRADHDTIPRSRRVSGKREPRTP